MYTTQEKKKRELLQSSIQEENDSTVYMSDTGFGEAQR